jgi:hypothetical protein
MGLFKSKSAKSAAAVEAIQKQFKSFDLKGADNLTWAEEETGLWKAWTFSPKKNRYFFDDIGSTSLMELWETQWKWEDEEK